MAEKKKYTKVEETPDVKAAKADVGSSAKMSLPDPQMPKADAPAEPTAAEKQMAAENAARHAAEAEAAAAVAVEAAHTFPIDVHIANSRKLYKVEPWLIKTALKDHDANVELTKEEAAEAVRVFLGQRVG